MRLSASMIMNSKKMEAMHCAYEGDGVITQKRMDMVPDWLIKQLTGAQLGAVMTLIDNAIDLGMSIGRERS